jgi:hypothetical protein
MWGRGRAEDHHATHTHTRNAANVAAYSQLLDADKLVVLPLVDDVANMFSFPTCVREFLQE